MKTRHKDNFRHRDTESRSLLNTMNKEHRSNTSSSFAKLKISHTGLTNCHPGLDPGSNRLRIKSAMTTNLSNLYCLFTQHSTLRALVPERSRGAVSLCLISCFIILQGCSDIFGSKDNATTADIFEQGRIDPLNAEDVVGYAAITPFWDGFLAPTDVTVGFDELVYVTDANGLHVLDRAGRRYQTIPLEGAQNVVQDRRLNVYVTARRDTVLQDLDPNVTWNLPVVYKIQNANGAGDLRIADIIWHPFDDGTRVTQTAQRARLRKDSPENDELVEFTGVSILADHSIYIGRRGPRNRTNTLDAPDNTIIEYAPIRNADGSYEDGMRFIRVIRNLNPTTPSLLSAIGVSSIQSFIGPPQREQMSASRSFVIAQADTNAIIPFRVLIVNAVETTDGLVFEPFRAGLQTDTTQANGFLYELFKFKQPTDIGYAADGTNYIFVTDAGTDSLYLFQNNGYEGVNPPAGSDATKPIIVSFGGEGSGAKQFRNPSGVAHFRDVVYVADTGNNRICRYKLTTDFE